MGLLRARRERPRSCRAAGQRDEVAPFSLDHLVGEQFIEVGTSMPSTLAGAASPDARRW